VGPVATENARPDIARLDNAKPYSKGGHRETCFSVRVDAHKSLCLLQGVLYVFSHISFCFSYSYVRQTKLGSTWSTFGCTKYSDWLIDQFQKVLFVIIASSCILSTCSMSARHQCEASSWSHEAHFATVVRGCCRGCRCRFHAPEVVAACTGACLFSSSSSLLLLLLLLSTRGCRDSVWAPTEWLTGVRSRDFSAPGRFFKYLLAVDTTTDVLQTFNVNFYCAWIVHLCYVVTYGAQTIEIKLK